MVGWLDGCPVGCLVGWLVVQLVKGALDGLVGVGIPGEIICLEKRHKCCVVV